MYVPGCESHSTRGSGHGAVLVVANFGSDEMQQEMLLLLLRRRLQLQQHSWSVCRWHEGMMICWIYHSCWYCGGWIYPGHCCYYRGDTRFHNPMVIRIQYPRDARNTTHRVDTSGHAPWGSDQASLTLGDQGGGPPVNDNT